MELIYNLSFDYTQLQEEPYRLQSFFDLENIQIRQVLTEYGLCYLTNSYLSLKYSAHYSIFAEFPSERKFPQPNVDEGYISVLQGSYFDKNVIYNFIGFKNAIDVNIFNNLLNF